MGANGRKEAQELVKRCEAVGWTVVLSGGDHWKVDTRRGIFMIPNTPGDARSMRNSIADAKRFGLDALEAKLVLRTEQDRQERIAADRAANDAKLAKIRGAYGAYDATNPFTPPKEPDDTVDTDTNLGEVDGVRIAAIAPVRYLHPRTKTGVLNTLRNAEELLLADQRIVYRCANTLPDGTLCHRTFDTALSLFTHNRYHSAKKENESVVKPTPADAVKKVATATSNGQESTATTRELLVTTIEELAGSIFEIGGRLIETRNSLIKMADQVKQLKPEVVQVEPDPEILAKAAKYDALRGLMQ